MSLSLSVSGLKDQFFFLLCRQPSLRTGHSPRSRLTLIGCQIPTRRLSLPAEQGIQAFAKDQSVFVTLANTDMESKVLNLWDTRVCLTFPRNLSARWAHRFNRLFFQGVMTPSLISVGPGLLVTSPECVICHLSITPMKLCAASSGKMMQPWRIQALASLKLFQHGL